MLPYAGAPLLHRLGPLAAPVAVMVLFYVDLLAFVCLLGTGISARLYLLLGPALAVLYFGPERITLTIASGAIAAALIIAVLLTIPHDTGTAPTTADRHEPYNECCRQLRSPSADRILCTE
jgi:adenylate cyclase